MVMHPSRARRRAQRHGDLAIVAPALHPHEKDLALQSGQSGKASSQAPLGFGGGELFVRVGGVGEIVIVDGYDLPAFALPPLVAQEIARDGEEPAPERRRAPPAAEVPESTEERLLDEIIDLGPVRAGAVQEPAQRPSMAVDQLRGRSFVSSLIGDNQLGVGGWLYGHGSAHSDRTDVEWTVVLSRTIIGGMIRRPSVIAHRGASGYEYENSRAAFRRAMSLDADGVELDVHATRDGVLVVHHDPDIPGNGLLSQLSFAETQEIRLPNREAIPRLADILDLVGERDVWVEVKQLPDSADTALLGALARGPAPERYAVHSFDHRIIGRLGERQPTLRRGILLSAYLTDPVAAMRAVGASTLWQEWHQIDRALVNLVHDAGGAVVAWTVNEIGDVQRLARLGVDGICGNYPDRVRIALASRGEDVSET